jgi:peptidyl-prolyl cis-trans isomerase SurA
MKNITNSIFIIFLSTFAFAQKSELQLIDGVVGVVGDNIILHSEVEFQKEQLQEQGVENNKQLGCYVWQDVLFNSLLIHSAGVDSIIVEDQEVDQEIDRRMQYFMMQMRGSDEEFQKYFGKTQLEFKQEIRPVVKNNIMARKMRDKITSDVTISPKEVSNYYKTIPKDSLPIIEEQYKVSEIVIKPTANEMEKKRVLENIKEIRQQIINGKDMGLMALIHSQDPGSASNKGELGFISRDQLVPEFSAVAFNLQPGELSEVVETDFGYHIIQMIERKGSLVNVRHILKIPEIYEFDYELAQERIDSIRKVLKTNPELFNVLASKLSDEESSSQSGGKLINRATGGDFFTSEELPQDVFLEIQNLKVKQITDPHLIRLRDNSSAFRILLLQDKIEFHPATLENDYAEIKTAALEQKKQKELEKWILSRIEDAYIRIPTGYEYCEELKIWYAQAQQ